MGHLVESQLKVFKCVKAPKSLYKKKLDNLLCKYSLLLYNVLTKTLFMKFKTITKNVSDRWANPT